MRVFQGGSRWLSGYLRLSQVIPGYLRLYQGAIRLCPVVISLSQSDIRYMVMRLSQGVIRLYQGVIRLSQGDIRLFQLGVSLAMAQAVNGQVHVAP